MIRIVDPLRTFVPWGARLKYMPSGRQHRRHHAEGISAAFTDANARQRVHLAKEHITEQVAKSMQYLQDMGQAVTAALANFGIDASYEVQGYNKEPTAEEKSKATSGEQGQRSEAEVQKEVVETAPTEAQPTAPPAPPATPAAPEAAEAEYGQGVEQAQEVKEISEDHHEKAEDGQAHLVKAPSEKFRHLEEVEEQYCKAVKESNEEEVNKAKGINLPNEAIDCRCFVSRVGRWQCPACCKKAGRTARRPGGRFSAWKTASSEAKKTSPTNLQGSDKSSSDSSEDSDFETLSHESFQDCSDRASPHPKVRKLSLKSNVADGAGSSNVNAGNETSNVYPTLSPMPSTNIDQQNEYQGIAFRMIEMGFSAEEVFRVVRMHGNNFERCVEEILKK
ncbi:hypothetical protein TELCIR_00448 [Teladorsagia circumcincta]|uniref:UBA domain-containing protein n=1 Tax=Teladorsagia circumcincta TaxID=45464 RepID=A0A2G9V4K1_TELCI|nr:hypothetical protein TELCIR_00448 [Teladorsagia circumcincta]